jgi:hypothetical protein
MTNPDFTRGPELHPDKPMTEEANRSSVRSLTPTLMLAGALLVVALLAVVFLWSPWDSDAGSNPVSNPVVNQTPVIVTPTP